MFSWREVSPLTWWAVAIPVGLIVFWLYRPLYRPSLLFLILAACVLTHRLHGPHGEPTPSAKDSDSEESTSRSE